MTQLTHKDIYTKFMIEYDKANVTSSYPSLTEYEVATFLDKAYNALIAQKITGNNLRRAGFEYDVKAISDLQSLIKTKYISVESTRMKNVSTGNIPSDFLYIVEAFTASGSMPVSGAIQHPSGTIQDENGPAVDLDGSNTLSPIEINSPIEIVTHDIAKNFMITRHNLPWVKNPIAYIEADKIYVVYDYIDYKGGDTFSGIYLRYIKAPNKFAKDLTEFKDTASYFDGRGGTVEFELNNTMAEELISLAIGFALENTESPRLNAKLNMRGLEV